MFYCKATKNYLHSHNPSEHLKSVSPLPWVLAPAQPGPESLRVAMLDDDRLHLELALW